MKEYSVFTTSYYDSKIYHCLNVSASEALTSVYGDRDELFEQMSDEDFFGEEYNEYNIYNIQDFLLQVESDMDYSWAIVSIDENGKIEETYPTNDEVLEWWQNMIREEIEFRKQNE